VDGFRHAVLGALSRASAVRHAVEGAHIDAVLLDAVGLATIIIDGRGRITAANDPWGQVAPELGVGGSYLEVCDEFAGPAPAAGRGTSWRSASPTCSTTRRSAPSSSPVRT